MWVSERLPFAYSGGGGGALKGHGSERHDVVDLPPMSNLLSLDTAGSDKEGDEDTHTTSSTRTPEL